MPLIASRAGGSATSFGGLGASVAPAAISAYESIATVTLSSATQDVDFTSIPQTFKHLQVRGLYRSVSSVVYFNVTTSAGQNWGDRQTGLAGNAGNNPTVFSSTGTTSKGQEFDTYVSALVANMYGPLILDIFHYNDTNKKKVVKGYSGYPDGDSFELYGAVFSVTNAITSLQLHANSTMAAGCTFGLYGIKD